jgi:hypothetical protein
MLTALAQGRSNRETGRTLLIGEERAPGRAASASRPVVS